MRKFILFSLLAIFALPLKAQNEDDVTTYTIPPNAIKTERLKENFRISEYFTFGKEAMSENLIGRETYYEEKLIGRALFKDAQLHGVQQSWRNNRLISEETYRNGIRDGVFRKWDECGRLIAQDIIINGNGTTHVYDEKGLLRGEESFKDNQPDGLSLGRFIGPDQRLFRWLENGKFVRGHYVFYMKGRLSELSWDSKTGKDGYKLTFDEDGAFDYKEWFVKGKSVAEAEYIQAATADPELPSYFSEAAQYKDSIPADVRAIEQKYRAMPPVKIPLELDEKGNPRLLTREDKRKEVLEYSIPADAKKIGPAGGRDRDITTTNFLTPSAAADSRSLLAVETFDRDILVERELFYTHCGTQRYSRIKHGVQREWYRNGQLKSEAPYWRGEMEGTFRHWSEEGRLIGQYQIHANNGTKRIYNLQGVLEHEETLSQHREKDMQMILQSDGTRWFTWHGKGNIIGTAYLFHSNGSLAGLQFHADVKHADSSLLHGLVIKFNLDGNVTEEQWFVNDKEVTGAEYSAVAAADATLPPYYADGRKYKKYLTLEIKNMSEKYCTAPKVKIPLAFDVGGNPLLQHN